MIKIKDYAASKLSSDKILSVSCGILLVRGIPAAAVSAGWELSAVIGSTGDILAVLIFFLGASAVNVTMDIANDKLINIGQIIISVLYILVSGKMHHQAVYSGNDYIIAAVSGIIDCVIMLFILNHSGNRTKLLIRLFLFTLIWCIFVMTDFLKINAEVLHPLLASLISGVALSRIIRAEYKINCGLLLLGMACVMMFDALF